MITSKTHLAFLDYHDYDVVVKYSYVENPTFAPFGDIDIHTIEVENIDMTPLLEDHYEHLEEIVLELHREKYHG
jgi:hypothetical protein